MNDQRILIVDDDAMLRALLTFKLKAAGFEVEAAENGRQALDRIAEARPDLIVLDSMMPVMDGTETLARLQMDPDMASIPVFMLTARRGDQDAVQALKLGAADFINKPFNPDELVVRISRHLGRDGGADPALTRRA